MVESEPAAQVTFVTRDYVPWCFDPCSAQPYDETTAGADLRER